MAIKVIRNNLIQLIDEYEHGIKDGFIRGYTKGSIETYGEILCVTRKKNDEAFHDYCMRLKTHLDHDFEEKNFNIFSCHYKDFNQDKSENSIGFCSRCNEGDF